MVAANTSTTLERSENKSESKRNKLAEVMIYKRPKELVTSGKNGRVGVNNNGTSLLVHSPPRKRNRGLDDRPLLVAGLSQVTWLHK